MNEENEQEQLISVTISMLVDILECSLQHVITGRYIQYPRYTTFPLQASALNG